MNTLFSVEFLPAVLFCSLMFFVAAVAALELLQDNRLARAVATEQPDGSILYPDGSRFKDGTLVREESGEVTESTPVSQLKFLAPGAKRALTLAGKKTVADLLEASNDELLAINGIAEKTVASIREHLDELGFESRAGG